MMRNKMRERTTKKLRTLKKCVRVQSDFKEFYLLGYNAM
jgi:hypothetical protein